MIIKNAPKVVILDNPVRVEIKGFIEHADGEQIQVLFYFQKPGSEHSPLTNGEEGIEMFLNINKNTRMFSTLAAILEPGWWPNTKTRLHGSIDSYSSIREGAFQDAEEDRSSHGHQQQ